MSDKVQRVPTEAPRISTRLFPALCGLLLGLALLKFGNPVIFEDQIDRPTELLGWLVQPWPLAYGYAVAGAVLLCGIVNGFGKRPYFPRVCWLPLVWVIWQMIATNESIAPSLSRQALVHFLVCVALFYLGFFCLSQYSQTWPFWIIISLCFIVSVRTGIAQHFGGLEATRVYFFDHIYPTLTSPPPDLIRKMKTNRIFATLFYPNTFAAIILLYVPVFVGLLIRLKDFLKPSIRAVLALLILAPSLCCLIWSGSKAGWLLFLLIVLIAIFHCGISRRMKVGVLVSLGVLGLLGFFVRYKAFFDKGATSVSARFDYWEAGWKTGLAHPITGAGPGTFGPAYLKIKRPDSEMARLAHNDYLEQWSDSGLVGFLAFFGFIAGSLVLLYRHSDKNIHSESFWIWLGLLAVSLHSFVEFHLYIPALAWPMFLLFGLAWGRVAAKNIDKGRVLA